ncbi:hypothetical protein EJP82_26230 [Paenibacillus anaericanus]|uniref:Uncharacterized protein n=1 Tax=Paenibacillus anaericanus TaxID=170367 RepID=A0A3S1BH50_9BACL|nr:phospholipase D-like domain-containing protein [Paenibacillus anaericanus]RUT39400.1 hypothetical protein EJP82_26230 [Paenibacillus anaericanus]
MIQTIIAQGIQDDVTFENHIRELLSDPTVVSAKALIAFATLNGILAIGAASSGELNNYITRNANELKWIIGIDSITTADALRTLKEIDDIHENVYIRAFESTSGLFHPKMFLFKRADGTGTVLVGSNNLTSGGLKINTEISVRLDGLSSLEVSNWETVWDSTNNKQSSIKIITDELLVKIQEIRKKERSARRITRNQGNTISVIEDNDIDHVDPLINNRTILIRQVPKAGDRVHQVHFTLDIARIYFHFVNTTDTRQIRLQQLQPNSVPRPIEQRRLVLSPRNMNAKIEVGGARVLLNNYPTNGQRPILVFEEINPDFFRYMLLLPGDDGFSELNNHLSRTPVHGNALAYDILNIDNLIHIWSNYPI